MVAGVLGPPIACQQWSYAVAHFENEQALVSMPVVYCAWDSYNQLPITLPKAVLTVWQLDV